MIVALPVRGDDGSTKVFSGYELIDAALAVFTFPDHGRFVLEFDDEKSFIHRIGLFIAWITKEKPFWFRASGTE